MTVVSPALTACLLAVTLAGSPQLPLYAQTTAAQHAQWAKDGQLLAEVQKALSDPDAFAGSSIMPTVKRSVVTLNGTVSNGAQRELASSKIGDIDGVKTVLNNLTVVDHTPKPMPLPAQGPTGSKVVSLPPGNILSIRAGDEINSKTAKPNDTFHGTIASTINYGGYQLIPAGTAVVGRVIDAKPAGHFAGSAELSIELVSVRLSSPNGPQDVALATEPFSNKAAGRGTNTAAKTGGGAAVGAVIGALAGGGAGAGIGALSGGALGGGSNVLSHGKEIDVKPEQLLQFRTAAPLDVTVTLQNGHQVTPSALSALALEARPAAPQQ